MQGKNLDHTNFGLYPMPKLFLILMLITIVSAFAMAGLYNIIPHHTVDM